MPDAKDDAGLNPPGQLDHAAVWGEMGAEFAADSAYVTQDEDEGNDTKEEEEKGEIDQETMRATDQHVAELLVEKSQLLVDQIRGGQAPQLPNHADDLQTIACSVVVMAMSLRQIKDGTTMSIQDLFSQSPEVFENHGGCKAAIRRVEVMLGVSARDLRFVAS